MEPEIQFLRQQIDYLERMLETCLARISSLEMQVVELRRRPPFIMQETLGSAPRGPGSSEERLILDHVTGAWVAQPRLKR